MSPYNSPPPSPGEEDENEPILFSKAYSQHFTKARPRTMTITQASTPAHAHAHVSGSDRSDTASQLPLPQLGRLGQYTLTLVPTPTPNTPTPLTVSAREDNTPRTRQAVPASTSTGTNSNSPISSPLPLRAASPRNMDFLSVPPPLRSRGRSPKAKVKTGAKKGMEIIDLEAFTSRPDIHPSTLPPQGADEDDAHRLLYEMDIEIRLALGKRRAELSGLEGLIASLRDPQGVAS